MGFYHIAALKTDPMEEYSVNASGFIKAVTCKDNILDSSPKRKKTQIQVLS